MKVQTSELLSTQRNILVKILDALLDNKGWEDNIF